MENSKRNPCFARLPINLKQITFADKFIIYTRCRRLSCTRFYCCQLTITESDKEENLCFDLFPISRLFFLHFRITSRTRRNNFSWFLFLSTLYRSQWMTMLCYFSPIQKLHSTPAHDRAARREKTTNRKPEWKHERRVQSKQKKSWEWRKNNRKMSTNSIATVKLFSRKKIPLWKMMILWIETTTTIAIYCLPWQNRGKGKIISEHEIEIQRHKQTKWKWKKIFFDYKSEMEEEQNQHSLGVGDVYQCWFVRLAPLSIYLLYER